jgi:DNA-binding IclR family transcriptional regulator
MNPAIIVAMQDIKKRKGIQSVEIGLKVLGALVGLGHPSSLSEIAKASDLSPSQTPRYLASLVNMRYLRQDPESALYDLHTGALRLGLASLARLDLLDEASRITQEFVKATGRTTLLCIWSELGPTIIRWFPGNPPIYTSLAIGSRLSLTHLARGRGFLAFQHEAYLSQLLPEEMAQARTGGTIDVAVIRQHVRGHFIADVDGTVIPGLRALAAPIFDLQGQLAIVISTDEINNKDGIGLAQVAGHQVAVFAVEGQYYATSDRCTHGRASLSQGYLEGHLIECPLHQGSFDVRTGAAVNLPCKVNLRTFPVQVADGFVSLKIEEEDGNVASSE